VISLYHQSPYTNRLSLSFTKCNQLCVPLDNCVLRYQLGITAVSKHAKVNVCTSNDTVHLTDFYDVGLSSVYTITTIYPTLIKGYWFLDDRTNGRAYAVVSLV